jgi:hypothetical protein
MDPEFSILKHDFFCFYIIVKIVNFVKIMYTNKIIYNIWYNIKQNDHKYYIIYFLMPKNTLNSKHSNRLVFVH